MRARSAGTSSPSEYERELESAWRSHLELRPSYAPSVVSLFAGCGGSSLGYSMAGFRELMAVEWNAMAAASFRANFPGVPVFDKDIRSLSGDEALRIAGVSAGELDVLDGSPPCQGFSMAGHRQLDDPRNGLFREYVRLLRAFNPKAFVMENVPGMVRGKMRLVFAEAMAELKAAGYRVSTRALDASRFGVPQTRLRLVFVGVRSDWGMAPSHPGPLSRQVTLREALDGVAAEELPRLSPKYRDLAPKVRPGQCAADHDRGKGFQNIVRPRWGRPCFTLAAMNNGIGRGTPVHPEEDRTLSVAEAKRIGSFPDEFVLEGSFQERWSQVGNSVPPLMMRAIAQHLRRAVLSK